jgi:hypothetical protein
MDVDTDGDGINDYEEVYGFSIEREERYETPYTHEEYDLETDSYIWRDSFYTTTIINSLWVTTNPTAQDSDSDGLPDGWERLFNFHPSDPSDGYADDDGDYLPNGAEYQLGTNLWNRDTDGDSVSDGEEVLLFQTDPLDPNDPGTPPPAGPGGNSGNTGSGTGPGTDPGTNPGSGTDPSDGTAGNGLTPDWLTWQGEHFSDLLAVDADSPEAQGEADPDGDELNNLSEFLYGTDPRDPDSDDDTLLDGWEVSGIILHFEKRNIDAPPVEITNRIDYGAYQWQSSSPLYDSDTITEIGIIGTWMRSIDVYDEFDTISVTTFETLERNGIYNSAGVPIYPEDGWLVNDLGELVPVQVPPASTEPHWNQSFDESLAMWVGTTTIDTTVTTSWWVYTDPLSADTDNDGMPDGWEYTNWLNPVKASDAVEDPDKDGLTHLEEFICSTDPWVRDTDGDDLNDGREVNVTFTDPLDPNDPGVPEEGTNSSAGVNKISTVTRNQVFENTGGGVLTAGGGGGSLPLSLPEQGGGGGGGHNPYRTPDKMSENGNLRDELYLEVRFITKTYGPAPKSGDPIDPNDGDGVYDGYWEETKDPVTDQVQARNWVPTGGSVGGSGSEGEDPNESKNYSAKADWVESGNSMEDTREENSSASSAIQYLQHYQISKNIDWNATSGYRLSDGYGASASFTAIKEKLKHGKSISRGSGTVQEARMVRKTGEGGDYLIVDQDVKRTFLKITKKRSAPNAVGEEWVVTNVEVVTLTIKSQDSKSVDDGRNPVDDAVLDPLIIEEENTAVSLLPVDLDIVHPRGGELDEAKQHDPTQGGLVAVRRGDITKPDGFRPEPLTKLVIRANSSVQGLKWKLRFNAGNNFKIWQDVERAQEVVSEQTEFDPTQDVTLYFEGLKKSGSVGSESVTLLAMIDSTSVETEKVYFTVVEAQVLIQVRFWIREGWIDLPPHPQNPIPNYKIAGGDRRDNSLDWEPGKGTPPLAAAPGYRVAQEVVMQPFEELNPIVINAGDVVTIFKPGIRAGSDEDRSGVTSLFLKHGAVPFSALPYDAIVNELLATATPTGTAPPPTDRMHIESSRSSDRKGTVRFYGAVSDPLVLFAADIDWDLSVTIDATDPINLKYEIGGSHDDYPAIEVNMKFDAKDPNPTTTPFTTIPQPYFKLHPLPSNVFDLMNGEEVIINPVKKGAVK